MTPIRQLAKGWLANEEPALEPREAPSVGTFEILEMAESLSLDEISEKTGLSCQTLANILAQHKNPHRCAILSLKDDFVCIYMDNMKLIKHYESLGWQREAVVDPANYIENLLDTGEIKL